VSDHRIAWALHNYELEQTIIRLRNSRNRLLDDIRMANTAIDNQSNRISYLEEELSYLQTRNRELSDIIAAP
jgi:hypothetical protein